MKKAFNLLLAALALLSMVAGCGSDPQFISSSQTIYFTQDYNPPYIDVLWMLDSRSPMSNARTILTQQATSFFQRLDSTTTQYRMGLVTADMQYARGALQPKGSPLILTKGLGTLEQRVQNFSSLISQQINLATSATNSGFQSALTALQANFPPKANVPLVLVFLSYSDDKSTVPGALDAVSYYSQAFLNLKGGRSELLRAYSINYTSGGKRCAQQYNADIDSAGFQNNYFNLAVSLGGSTGDLCESWSAGVDLSGLRLRDLPKVFTLEQVPVNPNTIQVSVTQGGQLVSGVTWKYDATANAIVFDKAPPEGSTIAVTLQ